MKDNNLSHSDMTNMQRKLFKELFESGKENTLAEHTRIALESLKAGGASEDMAHRIVLEALENLKQQGVTAPSKIPWYTK